MANLLSSSQLRAARALLNWSRAELADRAGVSEPTLHRFENDQGEAGVRTQGKLRSALENAGIDFLDNDGVRFRPEGLDVLTGEDGIMKFFDRVYSYAQNASGFMRQNGLEDRLFFKYAGGFAETQRARMDSLQRVRKSTLVRVLIHEGVVDFQCPDYAEYKWFSRTAPMPVPYYVFGDTVGIFALEKSASPRIYLISSPIVAAAYAKQFDSAWKMANNPGQFKMPR